jgi:hypothetical protein
VSGDFEDQARLLLEVVVDGWTLAYCLRHYLLNTGGEQALCECGLDGCVKPRLAFRRAREAGYLRPLPNSDWRKPSWEASELGLAAMLEERLL